MKLSPRMVACAALASAFLLGASTPCSAQAEPLCGGGGSYLTTSAMTAHFSISAVRLPGGGVDGHAVYVSPDTGEFVHVRFTSFMFVGGLLAMAGPVTKAVNTSRASVGQTAFVAVQDNGAPGTDRFTGLSVVPVPFGNLTIQQIIAILGPPPPATLRPIFEGGIRVH